jgi:hypothetical protein
MYGEDFDDGLDGNDDDSKDGGEEVNSKKKNVYPRGSKPREILEDGSLYCNPDVFSPRTLPFCKTSWDQSAGS